MVRILILRIAIVALLGYCLYLIYTILRSSSKKSPRDLESAEYDHTEWEKIKKELDKK